MLLFTNKLNKFPDSLDTSSSEPSSFIMPADFSTHITKHSRTIAYHTLLPLPYLWSCHQHTDSFSKSIDSNIFFDRSLHSTFFFFFIVLALFSDHTGNSYTVMPKLLIKLSVLSSLHFHSISDLDYRVHCFTNLLTFTLNSLDPLCFCHLALNTIVLYQPNNTRFFAGENHRKQEKWFL